LVKLTEEAFLQAIAKVDAGESIRSVAAQAGVDESTLRRRLKRRGFGAPDALRDDVVDPQEIPVIFRDYSSQPHHYVYPLGDLHKGSAKHQGRRWREWLGYLCEESDRSLLNTGDNFNSAIIGSKSDVYDEVMRVGDAKRELREELRPLAEQGRVDLMMPGNHEDRITRAVGDCPVLDVAEFLDIPYVRASALIVYQVGDMSYELYVRHGTGNGQSLATLQKSAFTISADVYVTGHTHRQAITADDYFYRDGERCVRRHRYFVNSGSFVGLENYAAQRGYAPTRIGAPRIFLDGRRHDVHVSL
jgi:UDP-2,3-diacylglucosamine pyrophosphatase LpxH